MTESVRPRIDLEMRHVMCPVHAIVFKDSWPDGAIAFSAMCAKWALEDEKVSSDVNLIMGTTEPDLLMIPKALEMKPVCCRMGHTKLALTFEAIPNFGRRARCSTCGQKRMGVRIEAANRVYPHMCFRCASTARSTPYTQEPS